MELVLVAVIGGLFGVGGPIAWFLNRLDKRNTSQHGESLGVLSESRDTAVRVEGKVDVALDELRRLAHRVDDHIAWHAHTAPSAPSVQSVVVNPVVPEKEPAVA